MESYRSIRPRTIASFLCLLFGLVALPAIGADFYVDPANGSDDGDGSSTAPWSSLQSLLDNGLVESYVPTELPFEDDEDLEIINSGAPVKSGDTIWLADGDYGELIIDGFYNTDYVTVRAMPGSAARFSRVLVRGSAMWRLQGLLVSAEFADPYVRQTLVELGSDSDRGRVYDIEVIECTIYSVADASGWTAEEWDTLSCNGIDTEGSELLIKDNLLKNVNFGITVASDFTWVTGNVVDGFAGDGMRGLGDFGLFEYNTIKNSYDVNDNHDDGFQSWSRGPDGEVGAGMVVEIILRGNTIINYEDPNRPHRGPLQGIGCFDGTYGGWRVENNVIMTDHWHGITLLGAVDCLILNNTVMDLNDEEPGPPWIKIGAHKDGTPSAECLVQNNLTTGLNNDEGIMIVEDTNLIITDPDALFVDAANFDLHLLPTAEAIDVGEDKRAPRVDADQVPRPQGDGIDIGAYEWYAGAVPDWDTDGDTETEKDRDGDTEGDTDDDTVEDGGRDAADLPEGDDETAESSCGCRAVGQRGRFSWMDWVVTLFTR